METLLAKLNLTGISSANEVVGYKASDLQDGTGGTRYDVCVLDHHREDRAPRQGDDGDCSLPDLWEGECA
jgi:hypothetical protein